MEDVSKDWVAVPRHYNAVTDFIDRNLDEGRAEKAAFIDPHKTLTYGGLDERAARFGSALAGLGVQREQRIALVMFDTVAMPVAFWGALKAGIVPVPVNTLLAADQYRYILQDCRAVCLVVSAGLLDTLAPILDDLPDLRHVIVADGDGWRDDPNFEDLLAQSDPGFETVETVADETAFWLYSSGSTGMPKGVRHRHASLIQTADLFGKRVLGMREDDVVYSAAKIFFAYGLGNAMSFPMAVGATTVLLPGRPTPDAVLDLMRTHQPSLFFGVPTLYTALLANPALGSGAGSDALRLCVSAGEALPQDVGERWKAQVGCDIVDGIGSTEMLHIFVSNRPDAITYGASGSPVPGYAARIVDDDGRDLGIDEIGELLVRGPSAGDGYWNQRAKSSATFVGEWTHTGDKYRQGADGLYYYCGRTDDMFKVSGNWVSPFDVESALMTHAAVLEAAVVGHPDGDGLLKPKAFIVLNDGFAADEALFAALKDHVKAASGPWKYPRWIEIRDTLPKTATGKIQRFKLREAAE
ncbi:MAG: benzoate-CoA ligase family protein [Pseudomonadota bacterium]